MNFEDFPEVGGPIDPHMKNPTHIYMFKTNFSRELK